MQNLNHHDIHEIISQISHSLTCPKCSSRILPHQIKITDMVDTECIFDVDCHKCGAELSLSAHVEKKPNDVAMTYNRSSQIMHDSIVEEAISERDVFEVKAELANFGGSFIEAFAR